MVTGIIIGWAVASVIGISKSKKWKKVSNDLQNASKSVGKKWYALFGKALVKVISVFDKKK